MRYFSAIIIALFLFSPSPLLAETKEIISEGTYVESYTKVKNLQLTEDEIKVLSSGLMEVEILDKKRTIVDIGMLRLKI